MDKIQNLHDLEYFTNISLTCELALKWSKARPKNKEIKALSDALTAIAFYVNRIQGDLQKHKFAISDYRLDKNKALLKYKEIKDKFDNLKRLEV